MYSLTRFCALSFFILPSLSPSLPLYLPPTLSLCPSLSLLSTSLSLPLSLSHSLHPSIHLFPLLSNLCQCAFVRGTLCRSCRCSMPICMYACMCLDVGCRFDVCAAAPFDARRVRCQVMRFDVCAARRSMPCEGSDESSIGNQQC